MPHQDFLLQGKFLSSSVLLFKAPHCKESVGYLCTKLLEPTYKSCTFSSSLHKRTRLRKQTKIIPSSLRPTAVADTESHNLHRAQFLVSCRDLLSLLRQPLWQSSVLALPLFQQVLLAPSANLGPTKA